MTRFKWYLMFDILNSVIDVLLYLMFDILNSVIDVLLYLYSVMALEKCLYRI